MSTNSERIRRLASVCIGSACLYTLTFTFGTGASAQNANDCDSYAASNYDPPLKNAGVPFDKINPVLAVPACEAAVRQYPNDARLLFQLGRAYQKANNFSAALSEFSKADEQGYAPAQFSIGVMYEKGYGVPQDYQQAISWYRQAAEQGFALAQGALSRLSQAAPSRDMPSTTRSSNGEVSSATPQSNKSPLVDVFRFGKLARFISLALSILVGIIILLGAVLIVILIRKRASTDSVTQGQPMSMETGSVTHGQPMSTKQVAKTTFTATLTVLFTLWAVRFVRALLKFIAGSIMLLAGLWCFGHEYTWMCIFCLCVTALLWRRLLAFLVTSIVLGFTPIGASNASSSVSEAELLRNARKYERDYRGANELKNRL